MGLFILPFTLVALGLVLAPIELVSSGNPLVPYVGMADPNLHFFNEKFYIFATHDFSKNNSGFLMKDWWCWSSDDLITWSIESVVTPAVTLPWSDPAVRDECWATDAAFRNDKFYFYLSVGGAEVAVVEADTPKGPWRDPLGKPLLSSTLANSLRPRTTFRDPCVFEDDDGKFYIIAGVFEYYVTLLTDDMVGLAEKPRHVTVNHPYGPCGDGKTDDKPFLHKENGTYYLSWGCFYATGTSVYGPFNTQGSVVSTANIAPDFRIGDTVERHAAERHHLNGGGSNGGSVLKEEDLLIRPRSFSPSLSTYRNPAVLPSSGDPLQLYECDNATAAQWVAVPSLSAPQFALALKDDPALCATAGAAEGAALTLQVCRNDTPGQVFALNPAANGTDIRAVSPRQNCDCWNVRDNNARGPGDHGYNGAVVQCYGCVDGQNFNPNQRFQFDTATGHIHAWDGYARGFCVAATYPGNPLPPAPPVPPAPTPPPPAPWFRHEDYTDRHGSFLKHNRQWYYASNDRSHSGDPRPAYFRDTVVCYVHFRANNTMEPCTINGQGVTAHVSSNIEAEEYWALSGPTAAGKIDLRAHGGGNGFAVALYNGSALAFRSVSNVTTTTAITAAADGDKQQHLLRLVMRVSNANTKGLPSEVVVSVRNVHWGTCSVPITTSWATYVRVSCVLNVPQSVTQSTIGGSATKELQLHDVVLATSGPPRTELLRLDRFAFE